MFSNLGGIFTNKPRQAEQTDTRQHIQRHDPDQQRRKSRDKNETEDAAPEEGATIAVLALRDFLDKLVKSRRAAPDTQNSAATQNTNETADNIGSNSQTDQPAPSAHVAMATSAYQQTARSVEKSTVLLETTDSAANGPEFDLSAADTRTIQVLMNDLQILNDAGIEFIHIERAETFLQSLVNATNAAKAQIP